MGTVDSCEKLKALRFRVQDLGFMAEGSGFRILG
jgi:hypothetical protein